MRTGPKHYGMKWGDINEKATLDGKIYKLFRDAGKVDLEKRWISS